MAAELREIVSFMETKVVDGVGDSMVGNLTGDEAIRAQAMDSYWEDLEEYYRMS